jgi:esterase
MSTSPILTHTRVNSPDGSTSQWLYLLHGIYGSGRNWGTLARGLVERRPDWGIILVDLRLHGGSRTGFSGPHTIDACVHDLLVLEQSLGLNATAILGHSFGGKVALARAAHPPDPSPDQVWVADSTLRTGTPSGSAWDLIGIVRGLPDRFASREELAEALVPVGYPIGVGKWLAMNLERGDDGFRWKIDWSAVEEMLQDYFETDVWPIIEEPGSTHVHVIRATESAAISLTEMERLAEVGERTGKVHVHTIEGGHWLNVDNPDAVLELLAQNL